MILMMPGASRTVCTVDVDLWRLEFVLQDVMLFNADSTIESEGQYNSTTSTDTALRQRLLSSRKASPLQTGQQPRGAYCLQAYCLGKHKQWLW